MVANRAEMKALEQKAQEFREFCRVHRRGIYAESPRSRTGNYGGQLLTQDTVRVLEHMTLRS